MLNVASDRGRSAAARLARLGPPLLCLFAVGFVAAQVSVPEAFMRHLEHPRVLLRLYPNLSHLLIAGDGMATPEEYLQRAGTVDQALINDVIRFIQEPPE